MKIKNNRILSLDAGGIKGIYSALVINRIEEKYDFNFNSDFDYYVGTSIGAVVAVALADGVKSIEILKKFIDFKKEIYKGHAYLADKLFKWIDYLFGKKKLKDIGAKFFIPLYNVLYKQNTYIDNYSKFEDYQISDILKAACSDLRVMDPYKISNSNLLFADAGFFAYDPILFFLRSNQLLFDFQIDIVSIGSGMLVNALSELNESNHLDMIYDSLLYEQFLTTEFFFDRVESIHYFRISEFPLKAYDKFSINEVETLVENKLLTLDSYFLVHNK